MVKKKMFTRRFNDNTYGIIHLPRLLALTIPFLFIVFIHIANVFVTMPSWLMEPIVQIAILFSGAVIAVLGLTVGFGMLLILLLVIWGITIYYYAQFIANWI